MAPRPLQSDRRSPREAALIAEVLEALSGRLRSAQPDGGADAGVPESNLASSDEVQELIAAAVSEINRVSSAGVARGGIAPVLGNGVLQSLIRQQHEAMVPPVAPAGDIVDERR